MKSAITSLYQAFADELASLFGEPVVVEGIEGHRAASTDDVGSSLERSFDEVAQYVRGARA